MRLAGKVALVTGGGSGIGESVSLLMARNGAKVVVVDVNMDQCEKTVESIKEEKGTAIALKANVSLEKEVKDVFDTALSTFGRVDIAHNHAGILSSKDACITEITEEAIQQTFDINVKGAFWGSKYAALAMKETGGGSIINTASDLAFIGAAGFPAYIASKGAIVSLTKALAVELAQYSIRVNAVCPGFIKTEMTAGLLENKELMDTMRESYLIPSLGVPEDVANAVIYLASDESSFVTGSMLMIDGGHTAF